MPSRVRVFEWLFYLDTLNTQANLHRKNVAQFSHLRGLLLGYRRQGSFFLHLPGCRENLVCSWCEPIFSPTSDIGSSSLPNGLNVPVRPFILLLVLWEIWDSRNFKVFRAIDLSLMLQSLIPSPVSSPMARPT